MHESDLSRIRVSLDVLNDDPNRPTFFEGLSDGRRWNGWATPLFTKPVADAIVSAFNKRRGTSARYEATRDAYVFVDEDGEEEVYGATTIAGKKLYGIGSGIWVWDDGP